MSEWRRLSGPLAGWARGDGPRLVFVHGFTQTSNSWKRIATHLAEEGYESVVVDAPAHGESTDVRVGLPEGAELLTALCGPAVYIGYSMGGRLCLHAAIAQPHVVRGLALIGASPGIADDVERAARRGADDRLANHIEDVDVDAFLDEWLAQPLFAGLSVDAEQRTDRLRNSAAGLASSLRLAGSGVQESLWSHLAALTMPVLTVAGELDEKYAAIGRAIAGAVPGGDFAVIAGAGHAAHLQSPDLVLDALRRWLPAIGW